MWGVTVSTLTLTATTANMLELREIRIASIIRGLVLNAIQINIVVGGAMQISQL